MPTTRPFENVDGAGVESDFPSGVTVRVLTAPSPVFQGNRDDQRHQEAVASLPARVAQIRREKETGGIIWNGTPIATDRESQSMMTGALVMLQGQPGRGIKWKTPSGAFFPMDLPTLSALVEAVFSHVEACFDREAELMVAVEAAIDPSTIDITTGWPT